MEKICGVNETISNSVGQILSTLALAFLFWGNGWAATDKLCIPNHEGLPHEGSLAPTVDGYIGRTEIPDISGDPRLEQGWVRSALLSYAGGGSEAYTEARIIKDRNQPYVYLSFLVRNDPAFDDDDSVVVIMDPGWNTSSAAFTTQARRVIIQPVNMGAGAPGTAGVSPNYIRQDRPPARVEWSKYTQQGTQPVWSDMTNPPSNNDIKVRSWDHGTNNKGWSIEIKLPLNTSIGGSEWTNLASSFGLYFNVIKLCGASTCIGTQPTTEPLGYYTNQYAWPRIASYTSTPLSPGLITGTAATLKKLINNTVLPSWLGQAEYSSANSTCKGVRFAGGPAGIGVLATDGSLGTTIDGRNQATNTLVARLTNDGAAADGEEIRATFRIANWGVGGGPGTWDKIPARPASSVIPSNLSNITPLNAGETNTNPTARKNVPAGAGQHDFWMQMQVQPGDNYCDRRVQTCPAGSRDAHSCIWVELDSKMNATISESSIRRNFDITTLSAQRSPVEISAKGWGAPVKDGEPQQFMLFTTEYVLYHPGASHSKLSVASDNKQIVKAPIGISSKPLIQPDDREINAQLYPPLELELLKTPGIGKEPLWNYVWMVHANRATPMTMTIGSKTYRVYEPAGSFGRIGQHFGNVDRFIGTLSGEAELKQLSVRGPQLLTVANESTVRLNTKIEAVEPGVNPCSCKCACGDWKCQLECQRCEKQASINSGTISGTLALVGTLGAGGFAFLRRRRKQASNGERAES